MGAFSSSKSLNQGKPKKQFSIIEDYPKPIDSENDQPKATNNSNKIKGSVWFRKVKFPEDDNIYAQDEVITEITLKGSLNHNQLQQRRWESRWESRLCNSDPDLLMIPKQYGILKKYHSQSSSRSNSAKRVKFNLDAIKIHSIGRMKKQQKKIKRITMSELDKLF